MEDCVDGEFTTSIVLARCRKTSAGSLRWRTRLDAGLRRARRPQLDEGHRRRALAHSAPEPPANGRFVSFQQR